MLHHLSSKQQALSSPSRQMPSSRASAMPQSLAHPQSCRLLHSPCAALRQLPAVLLRVWRSSKLVLLSQQRMAALAKGLLRLQESRDTHLHLQSLACQLPGPGQSHAARHSVMLPRLQQQHPSIRLRMLLLLLLLLKIWQAVLLLPGILDLLLLVWHIVLLNTCRALLLLSRLRQQQQGQSRPLRAQFKQMAATVLLSRSPSP